MLGRGGPQLEDDIFRGIVVPVVLDRADAGVGRDARRREIGLSGAKVDHVLTGSLPALGLGRNCDRRRGLEVLQIGREPVPHGRIAPYRLRIVTVESMGNARTTPRKPRTVSARNNEL